MGTRGHFPETGTRPARDSDGSVDSSWIGVFSRVSRPARFLMQRYLPAAAQTAFDMKSPLDIGSSLMGGLADPPLEVAQLRCRGGHAETPSWMTSDSLGELGVHSTARADLSMQERNCPSASCTDAHSWWSGLWGAEESPQNWLLNVPQSRKETGTSWQHCGQHHSVAYCQSHSLAAVALTTELCVCRDYGVTMHSKSTAPLCSSGQIYNACVPTAIAESLTNSHMLPTLDDEQKKFLQSLVCRRTFSEVAVLSPDQDNGYSSWEEEQSNSKFNSMRFLSEEQQVSEADGHVASGNVSPQRNTVGSEPVEQFHSEPVCCIENIKQTENDSELCDTEKNAVETSAAKDLPALPTPHCQNKAIAFIMGSPCSDESESEDNDDQESDDEDDGFDSESSESEDSEDSDDESEDEEDADSETERLWSSLCQNGDPYNPRNFTAPLRTVSKPASAESSVSESPQASISSGLSPPPSSPTLSENESLEACEMDEENLRLWNSFSSSADPYSLFNFQAPIQNQKPPRSCQKKTAARPLRCRSREAEERLDSGFSEVSPVLGSDTVTGAQLKKVQFVEEVEEFYISSDEDRHGPWEEIARDRCRFQRRVQEVEETISYCFSPTFRLTIFQRLYNTS